MRRFLITLLLLLASFVSYSQNWLDDSNFEDKINEKSAFGDDETNVVVVEFWVEFNKQNAFEEWKSLEGVTYYRVDIEKAPKAKKKYRIRMAPSILIFKDGIVEESFKAGLDLELPTDLQELQKTINESKKANRF